MRPPPHEKSLANVNSELAKQWHPILNESMTPELVTAGSGKKVWWICAAGHEWQAQIASRNNGRGCPYCSNRKVAEENSLASVFPDVASKWHEKNAPLKADMVAPKSNRLVWWKCEKGHEWQAKIADQTKTRKSSCPYCMGRKVSGDNNLQHVDPQLSKQWHPQKNGDLTAKTIFSETNKSVWWQCKKGHAWKTSVASRRKGSQCPYCSGRKASAEYNLLKSNRNLADEWHLSKNGSLSASDVTPNSNKKVWWQCSKGHEWEAIIASRSNGTNCPYCSGNKVSADNSLNAVMPNIAEQWHPTKNHPLTPNQITAGSGKYIWWQCADGHAWKAPVFDRKKGAGCPYCSGNKVGPDNNLEATYPDIAKQWHPTKNDSLSPLDVTSGSGKKVWWVCDKGHEWKTMVSTRTRGRNCPHCKNTKTSKPELRIYAELSGLFANVNHRQQIEGKEIDIYLPDYGIGIEYDGYYFHQKLHKHDLAKNTHFHNVKIRLVRFRQHPLPLLSEADIQCKGNRVTKAQIDKFLYAYHSDWFGDDRQKIERYLNFNSYQNNSSYRKLISCLPGPLPGQSLLDNNPDLESEWHFKKNHPLQPSQFAPRSNQSVWWHCKEKHEWKARIADRTTNHGCPYCTGKKATPENNLATANPEIAASWHPEKNGKLSPGSVTPKSNRKVYWQCKNGHEWQATVWERSNGLGCPYCSGKRVSATNNLSVVNPALANEWHPTKNKSLTAVDVTSGSRKSVWWKCTHRHEWSAIISNRNKGDGCPYCAGKRASTQNNLATINPQIAKQWHPKKNVPLSPEQVTAGSKKKVWWICVKGHEWQAVIHTRNAGVGCPYCSGRKTCADNCLENVRPDIAKEWNHERNKELTPSMFTEKSGRKVWWQCSHGHEWQTKIASRSNGTGCPSCAGKVASDANNLKKLYPETALEWNIQKNGSLTPEKVVPGSHKKVWWKCRKGHEWRAVIRSRVRGSSCPHCK